MQILELLITLMNEGLIRGGEDVDAETLQGNCRRTAYGRPRRGCPDDSGSIQMSRRPVKGFRRSRGRWGIEMESAAKPIGRRCGEQPVEREATSDADFFFPDQSA